MSDDSGQNLESRLQNIRLIVTDVDGVLTDGKIVYNDLGVESKNFNVKDGLILKYLKSCGFLTGVITGRDSEVVKRRCKELKFDFHHHGIMDKAQVLSEELEKRDISWEEVIYIGDDINDLPLIRKCGIGVCPSDASEYIQQEVDFVTVKAGGEGVLREVADRLLKENNFMHQILNPS